MEIPGWKYYNHAAVPTTAPHIDPDIAPINDGTVWKMKGSPLLARWTTDFDCGYETNWWYVIKDTPFDIEEATKKNKKSIRQALRKCYVKKIDCKVNSEAMYICYKSAFSKYENADNMQSKEQFMETICGWDDSVECWGGYDSETNTLIGYLTVFVFDIYAEIRYAKFNPEFSSNRVSDALYYTVLDYYLTECSKKYVSSGSRNINHKTNTQEYKINRFGFRKAFCNLHIEYNPKVSIIIKVAYLFRNILKRMDGITLIHQVNAILLMEELAKSNFDGNDSGKSM